MNGPEILDLIRHDLQRAVARVNGGAKVSHWGGDILGQSRWLKAAASGARPHGAVASERPPGRCA